MDLGITGKVALVTGGARSLGKQDCLTLGAEGCKVIVLDLNGDGAAETAKEIGDAGGTARGYAVDITDRPALADVVQRAEREVGPVDICVNNAGWIYTVGQLKDMKDEDWDMNLTINLTGTYNVTKAVFAGMRERRWGRVICMASIAGLMGGFGQTAYSTGKMGVIGFARSVALEGARYGVTATARRHCQRHRVSLLGACPLHHRRRPDHHRRDGPVHLLTQPAPRRSDHADSE